MTTFDATEAAYKNGYAAGIKEKLEYIDFLQKRCEELKKERDAAIADLTKIAKSSNQPCDWCANYFKDDFLVPCMMCDDEEHNGNFEWRGLSLENKTSDKEEKEK